MHKQAEYTRLQTRLTVDRYNIDQEYIENPAILHEALEHLAYATEARDQRKAYTKNIEAAVALQSRDELGINNKAKTEGAVAAEVASHPEVVIAREQAAEAGLDVQLWEGMVEALRARGYTLRGLTDMTCAGMMVTGTGRAREPIAEVLERRHAASDEPAGRRRVR